MSQFALGEYLLVVLVGLAIFAVVGHLLIATIGPTTIIQSRTRVLLAPGVGMAATVLVATIVSRYGIGITSGVTWVIIGGFVLVGGSVAVLRRLAGRGASPSPTGDGPGTSARQSLGWLIVAPLVGLAPYFQLFLRSDSPARHLTSATWTNNDLGAYLMLASNVRLAGTRDAGLLTGFDLGRAASFDHPGTQVLFAFVSGMFRTLPHRVGIVTIAIALGAMWCATVATVELLTDRTLSMSRSLVLSAVIVNVAIVSVTANFFLSQIVSLMYVFVLFGLLVAAMRAGPEWRTAIVAAIVFLACYVSSPEIALPMGALIASVTLVEARAWRSTLRWLAAAATFAATVVVFALVRYELFASQFEVITRNAGHVEAGWKSNFSSVMMLAGLAPNQFGGPFGRVVTLMDVGILVVIGIWMLRHLVTRRTNPGIFLGVALVGTLLVVASLRWGFDGYRTWKLVATCTPIVFVLLFTLAWSGHRDNARTARIAHAAGLVVVGATIAWSASVWAGWSPSRYVEPSLMELAATPEVARQRGVNIDVGPYFETMAAAVLVGDGAQMISPSYYWPFGQPPKGTCTLTTRKKAEEMKEKGPIVASRGAYVLVGTPRCD